MKDNTIEIVDLTETCADSAEVQRAMAYLHLLLAKVDAGIPIGRTETPEEEAEWDELFEADFQPDDE